MTQLLAHYGHEMIGVIQIKIVVSPFINQAGWFVLRAITVVKHHDDGDILASFSHHQPHFGDGGQVIGQPQQNQVEGLVINRATDCFYLVGIDQLDLIAIATQGLRDMVNIGSGTIHYEQIDNGRLRHALQPLLMTGNLWGNQGLPSTSPHRSFGRLSRLFSHQSGHQIARKPPTKFPHNSRCLHFIHLKMGRATHAIQQIQIIGHHPDRK